MDNYGGMLIYQSEDSLTNMEVKIQGGNSSNKVVWATLC